MTIPPAFLDELRARVSLGAVVGRRVKLTRAGRELKGCCPFHNEKSPSFFVNDEKAFYHCFGCGVHGDVIRFVVEQEGLSFRDAVASLAAEAGLPMPVESAASREREQAQAGLHDITGAAASWFTEQLAGSNGEAARAYLSKRGIDAATAKAFGLGFAPDSRNRLRAALGSLGIDKLVETGLLIAPDAAPDNGSGSAAAPTATEPYDRFRGRLIFPIRDPRGRVIGFGGRILGDGQPKYLNSPDTPLFDKGRTLYNLDRAAPLARKSGRLLVVEGYMDVIGLAQAGIADAVAPLGTALTEMQLQLLWRVVPEPILCFDGDGAGQRAGLRAALRALPLLEPGHSLRFATLPVGQDPDDLVRSGGAAAMEALCASAEPLVDRLWKSETVGVDLTTPERRAALLAKLDGHAASIAHPELKRMYRTELRDRFYSRPDRPAISPRAPNPRFSRAPVSPGVLRPETRPDVGAAMLRQVLVAIVQRPQLIETVFEQLAALTMADATSVRLLAVTLDAALAEPNLDAAQLRTALAADGLEAALDGLLQSHRPGLGNLAFMRLETPLDEAASLLARFLDALLASKRAGDEFSAVTSYFRSNISESGFDAHRRNLGVRAALADKDQVIGIDADSE